MKKPICLLIAAALVLTAGVGGIAPSKNAKAAQTNIVKLDPSDYSESNGGKFEGWGTSLCWWANRVGYSEELTEQTAEAFFSDNGLSLDIARYNVGGGDDPTHTHITRSDSKVPGLWETYTLSDDGKDVSITYDLSNDQNQFNVAKAALEKNSDIYFEGFSNSPPYFMTNSGCSSGAANSSNDNLKTDMYDDFAEYIADSTKLLSDNGIVFKSYSPMNEPDTSYWGANSWKQEGCHYDPGTSESNMIVEARNALDNAGLTDVLVAGMDETSIDTTVTNLEKLTDEAKTALGRIDTHTYDGSEREALRASAKAMGKDLWMSEVDGGWDGFGLSERIITDVNGMMPSAWVMWDIVDIHKDSTFTDPSGNYTEKDNSVSDTSALWGVAMADHDEQKLVLTNKYYFFGQFTKYINPGDTIIASSDYTLAAYNRESGDIKIVALNSDSSEKSCEFDMSAFTSVGNTVTTIRTNNSDEKWAEIENGAELNGKTLSATLAPSSVTTYIISGNTAPSYAVISGNPGTMMPGQTAKLTVVTDMTGDGNVVWTSSDTSVAAVSEDGTVTAVSDGTATVSVSAYGMNMSTEITVKSLNEIIHLSFDNSDLSSSAGYGTASGDATFAEVDGEKCVQFSGSSTGVITLSGENGSGLLAGLDEFTVKLKAMPTSDITSWWFYTSPNDSAQTYQSEKYFGIFTNGTGINAERYNNSGSRSQANYGTINKNEWNDVIVSVSADKTVMYINGVLAGSVSSGTDMTDLLGDTPIAYIGKANWGSGEYATGYLDEFVVYDSAVSVPTIDLGDLSDVREDLTLPETADGFPVTWTSSNTDVITADGKVTRPESGAGESVTLTASVTVCGTEFKTELEAFVPGKYAAAESFAAYADGMGISFSCDYSETDDYDLYVAVKDGNGYLVSVKMNTPSGHIDVPEHGKYTIECMSWDGCKPVYECVRKTISVKEEQEMSAYLFVHFAGTESDATCEQIYFSLSEDGSTWTTVNGGSPVLTSTVGESGVRDPYILRGEDGRFFIIATDLSIYNRRGDSSRWSTCQTSGSKSIVIWESDDLVNWSDASLVEVAVDNAGCTWAPEAVYDPEKDMYMVFWASKVSDDNYSVQRMYKSYTSDFKTFTEPEVYIDGGSISNIDTTIVSDKGIYYRFTKNESNSSVTMMSSARLNGEWKDVSTYTINGTAGNTVTGYEGPAVYKLNGSESWCLLLDYYSKSQGYKPFVTDDISTGEFTTASDFSFDATYRHGTVLPITAEEYNAISEKYSQ